MTTLVYWKGDVFLFGRIEPAVNVITALFISFSPALFARLLGFVRDGGQLPTSSFAK